MKYALAVRAAVLGLLAPACTEPVRPDYFEGTITSVFVIKDIYNTANSTTEMKMAQLPLDPMNEMPGDPCRQADVHVSDSTFITRIDKPTERLSRDALAVLLGVRVSPLPSRNSCPLAINAKSIVILTVLDAAAR